MLYDGICRNWVESHPIGSIHVDQLGTAEIYAWLMDVQQTAGPSAAVRYFAWLKSMLKKAAREKPPLLVGSPWLSVTAPTVSEPARQTLDVDDMRELVALVDTKLSRSKDRPVGDRARLRLKRAIVNACHGLRPAENVGLRWEDWTGEGWQISRQSQEIPGLRFLADPKSENGFRFVPIAEEYWYLFAEARIGFVLDTRSGKPMRSDELRRDLEWLVEKTRFVGLRLYDLRSSFATALADAKTNPRTAADIMGQTPEVWAKKYLRSDMRRTKEAISEVWASTRTRIHTEKTKEDAG